MWHMPGRRSSLLDLFYSSKPELITNIENTTNLLSKHDGVSLHINTKEAQLKPQYEIRRNYTNVTSDKLLELLDKNKQNQRKPKKTKQNQTKTNKTQQNQTKPH